MEKIMKFKLVAIIFSVFSSLIAGDLQAFPIQHLRIIMHENPSQEITIAWTIPGHRAKARAKIYLSQESGEGILDRYPRVIQINDDRSVKGEKDRIVFSKIKDLSPSTKYYFVAQYGEINTREYHFKMAPKDKNKPFKLLFGGDSRSYRGSRQQMNLEIKSIFEKNPEIVALVHGGDMIASGGNWGQWKSWFSDHTMTTTENGRILPIIPTQGNHETDTELFNELFVMDNPNLKRDYYVSRISDLAIVTLNTNISHAGNQRVWLNKTLRNLSRNAKWIIPNYHRPAFPAVKRPGGALKHWVPLFDKYQVDLVFESDGHALKRTAPIYRGKINHDLGITYVGEGGLGVKLRSATKRKKWYFQNPGYATSKYHVLMLDVSADKIIYTVNTPGGIVFDTLELLPRNRSDF